MIIMKGSVWAFETVLYLQSARIQHLGQWSEELQHWRCSVSNSSIFSPGKAIGLSTSWVWLNAKSVLESSPGRQAPLHMTSHGLIFPRNCPSICLISLDPWNTCSINFTTFLSWWYVSFLFPLLLPDTVRLVVHMYFYIEVLLHQTMWVKFCWLIVSAIPVLMKIWCPLGVSRHLLASQSLFVRINLI